jgi:8-oxo-dGTP diphosphatase
VIDMPQKDKIELTNMVMIEDKTTGKVLVQERIKSWCGLTFPGGHVEEGESFVDSAVREVKEETGLDVKNLR